MLRTVSLFNLLIIGKISFETFLVFLVRAAGLEFNWHHELYYACIVHWDA